MIKTKQRQRKTLIFQESDFFQSIFNFYMIQNNFTYSNHSNQLTHLHVHMCSLKTENFSFLFLMVKTQHFVGTDALFEQSATFL